MFRHFGWSTPSWLVLGWHDISGGKDRSDQLLLSIAYWCRQCVLQRLHGSSGEGAWQNNPYASRRSLRAFDPPTNQKHSQSSSTSPATNFPHHSISTNKVTHFPFAIIWFCVQQKHLRSPEPWARSRRCLGWGGDLDLRVGKKRASIYPWLI